MKFTLVFCIYRITYGSANFIQLEFDNNDKALKAAKNLENSYNKMGDTYTFKWNIIEH